MPEGGSHTGHPDDGDLYAQHPVIRSSWDIEWLELLAIIGIDRHVLLLLLLSHSNIPPFKRAWFLHKQAGTFPMPREQQQNNTAGAGVLGASQTRDARERWQSLGAEERE